MVTKDQAMTAREFVHFNQVDSRGQPVKVRRNGQTKTWKREPGRFRIPVKYGLKQCFYIEWNPRIGSELDGVGNAPQWDAV